jgi:chromate transporter
MHRILVEEKRWIGEHRFLHALNYCMLLPGPEAQQLAVYIGWLLHKTRGGLVAGALFVLPGFLAIMALSWIYAAFGQVGIVAALFFGLKAAVLAVVLEAVVRIGRRALKNGVMVALAGAAFVAIFFFDVPFPVIILAAGIIGFFGGVPASVRSLWAVVTASWMVARLPTPIPCLVRSYRTMPSRHSHRRSESPSSASPCGSCLWRCYC